MDICNRLEAGKWSEGRPVFKKIDGEERFLFVKEGTTTWSIRRSLTASEALIESGRATNSPTSPEAGPSGRFGTTRWRFWDGSNFVEGDIRLTCKPNDDNEDDSNNGDNVT